MLITRRRWLSIATAGTCSAFAPPGGARGWRRPGRPRAPRQPRRRGVLAAGISSHRHGGRPPFGRLALRRGAPRRPGPGTRAVHAEPDRSRRSEHHRGRTADRGAAPLRRRLHRRRRRPRPPRSRRQRRRDWPCRGRAEQRRGRGARRRPPPAAAHGARLRHARRPAGPLPEQRRFVSRTVRPAGCAGVERRIGVPDRTRRTSRGNSPGCSGDAHARDRLQHHGAGEGAQRPPPAAGRDDAAQRLVLVRQRTRRRHRLLARVDA